MQNYMGRKVILSQCDPDKVGKDRRKMQLVKVYI